MKQVKNFIPHMIVILLIINSIGFAQQARYIVKEKEKPIPLADLQNPDSPSYVPIPYPKTREEVIVDFKYVLKRRLEHLKRYPSRRKTSRGSFILFMDLLNKKSKIKIGNIIRVKNYFRSSPLFYYTFSVKNSSGLVLARISLRDSGLFSQASYGGGSKRLRDIQSPQESIRIFQQHANRLNIKLDGNFAQHAQFEYVSFNSPRCNPNSPMRRTAIAGIFYYLDDENNIYREREKVPLTEENILAGLKREHFRQYHFLYPNRQPEKNARPIEFFHDYVNMMLLSIEWLNYQELNKFRNSSHAKNSK